MLGARAVPTKDYVSSYGPVLFTENGFSIVAIDTAADGTWKDLILGKADRPVVVNTANARLGVVTGTLIVKLKDVAEADRFAGRQNLQLLSVDDLISTAYYRAPEGFPMLAGAEQLRQDAVVESIEVETVSGHLELR